METKQKIKVKFCDWLAGGSSYSMKLFIRSVLERHYTLEDSDSPDFVFYSPEGTEHFRYQDSVKVFFCGEENFPNFNVCDYAATLYPDLIYQNRVFSDLCVLIYDHHRRHRDMALVKHVNAEAAFSQKTKFCCFVQTYSGATTAYRDELFERLSRYKLVDSGGAYKNNIGHVLGGRTGGGNEFDTFGLPYKFCISCLNAQNYTLQDRPENAFAIQSVPIFWGNPAIGEIYNEEAFINCHRYSSIDEVIERVIELDNDDEQYLNMLRTPAFLHPETSDEVEQRFENWLKNIIEHGTKQRSGGMHNRRENFVYEAGYKKLFQRDKLLQTAIKVTGASQSRGRNPALSAIKRKILRY